MASRLLIIAGVAFLATGAGAQRFNYPVTRGDALRNGDSLLTDAARYNASFATPDQRECLKERKTGRRVCRTRAQWREVAERIEAGRDWRD